MFGAYAIVWLALLVYVIVVVRGLKKTEAQMAILEEELARRASSANSTSLEDEPMKA